jgi:hypothetical protein
MPCAKQTPRLRARSRAARARDRGCHARSERHAIEHGHGAPRPRRHSTTGSRMRPAGSRGDTSTRARRSRADATVATALCNHAARATRARRGHLPADLPDAPRHPREGPRARDAGGHARNARHAFEQGPQAASARDGVCGCHARSRHRAFEHVPERPEHVIVDAMHGASVTRSSTVTEHLGLADTRRRVRECARQDRGETRARGPDDHEQTRQSPRRLRLWREPHA